MTYKYPVKPGKGDNEPLRREMVRGLRSSLSGAPIRSEDGATVEMDMTVARRLVSVCVQLEQFLSGERI